MWGGGKIRYHEIGTRASARRAQFFKSYEMRRVMVRIPSVLILELVCFARFNVKADSLLIGSWDCIFWVVHVSSIFSE